MGGRYYGAVRWGEEGEHSRVLDVVVGFQKQVLGAIGAALSTLPAGERVGYLGSRRPDPEEELTAAAPFVVMLVMDLAGPRAWPVVGGFRRQARGGFPPPINDHYRR